jgi:hypothetical protein
MEAPRECASGRLKDEVRRIWRKTDARVEGGG